MNSDSKFIDEKVLNTFYLAAGTLIKEFSEENLKKVIEAFKVVNTEDLIRDKTSAEEIIANLPNQFYDYLAERFSANLNEFPEFWLINDCRLYVLFSEEIAIYINEKIINEGVNTVAGNIYEGSNYLDQGSPELAILHFNQVEHYIGAYFRGFSYMDLENYPNAIRNFQAFLDGLNQLFAKYPDEGFDSNFSLNFFMNDVHLVLGYLYNVTKHYIKAKTEFEKVLTLDKLEDQYYILSPEKSDTIGRTTFEIFINNYLLALDKIGDYVTAINVLQKVLELMPGNYYYKKQLKKFVEGKGRQDTADDILSNVKSIKRPYNIISFNKTQQIAREKVLEDMIVEQIKYRGEVFGKKLELYQDNKIYGRQYFLKEINGRLDLLLIDKTADVLYVVELKRNSAGLEVVSQIESYMAALKKEIAKPIKGIIFMHKSNPALIEKVKAKKDLELFTYKFDFEKLG
ncbi:endonuclease NucS [Weeksellaceae bacterium KMM 9724]|uniref:endonuclease NucS domain-containing protein n=1 Tax=Profundicola chukchiensis TaxID=2961959 RepID=UPI00243CEFB8|nr:endonuclease NucS domain-containing protein [Profundicola chukchiensis]MDG4949629.1 endonuclease NucS [Profundicola chukchiensis]